MVKLAARYELIQRIDAQSIMTKVHRIVEVIGVDVELIGIGNAYTTAFVLLVRSRIPFEWNRFCEYVDRQSWKVEISNKDAQSSREVLSADEYNEWGSDELINDSELHVAPEKAMVGGLAQAFEHSDFAAYADEVLNECRDQRYQPEVVAKLEPETCRQRDRSQFKRFGCR